MTTETTTPYLRYTIHQNADCSDARCTVIEMVGDRAIQWARIFTDIMGHPPAPGAIAAGCRIEQIDL